MQFFIATSANDAVIKPEDPNIHAARKQWGQQKTQVVSALEKIKLQTATSTIMSSGEGQGGSVSISSSPGIGKTITIGPSSPDIGQTITVSKQSTAEGLPVVGGIPGSPASPQTVVLKKDKLNTVTEEDDEAEEKKGPVTAWENKPSSPKGM